VRRYGFEKIIVLADLQLNHGRRLLRMPLTEFDLFRIGRKLSRDPGQALATNPDVPIPSLAFRRCICLPTDVL
jgi:hypothetical protein